MKLYVLIISFLIIYILQSQAQSMDTISIDNEWYFSLSNDFYFLPEDAYADPSFTADRAHLHFEVRYNSEDYQTFSVWGGYNISVGNKFGFSATPMLGIVFGNTDGIAPDLILDIYYGRFDLYSDNEYLIDFKGQAYSYFYTWTELTYAPTDWMHFGLAFQRTKLHQTESEIEKGFTLGFTYKFLALAGYVFNPGSEYSYGFLNVGISF